MMTTDSTPREVGSSEGLGPLPAQWPTQAHMMSICISTAHDGGHWYSPAAVQERIDAAVAAERARIRQALLDMQAACTDHNHYAHALVATGLRA